MGAIFNLSQGSGASVWFRTRLDHAGQVIRFVSMPERESTRLVREARAILGRHLSAG